jgi:transcriptional regulator with XRE-family HTH domain
MFSNTDVHVGQRVRNRRWALGMPQKELAEAVGIRFQQIQKYETGANRISASRLWDIAKTLDVPVEYFFDGLGKQAARSDGWGLGDLDVDKEAIEIILDASTRVPALRQLADDFRTGASGSPTPVGRIDGRADEHRLLDRLGLLGERP